MGNEVVVGTKRWAGGQVADEDHPAIAEVLVPWVRIGEVVLTAEEHHLLSVTYQANGDSFSKVTIILTPAGFRTVPHDGPESPGPYDVRTRHSETLGEG